MFILEKILSFLVIILPILISVAYLTLAERKIMGALQQRIGPNVVGFYGFLQPLADGLKLFLKETVVPKNASTFNFLFTPVLGLFLSLFSWSFIPFSFRSFFVEIDLSMLFILAVSSLSVYSIIFSGWASNSRYAFFGSIRSACQMISYEINIGVILVSVFLCVNSLCLLKIVDFQRSIFFVIPLFPLFIQFLVCILAETNRAPFDLPEAESELVSGFNVEYSAMGFALFFLAEYSSIILMSSLAILLFFGGWLFPWFKFTNPLLSCFFALKVSFIIFFFIWVRASYPRYRVDQLMRLCWKIFLPLSFSFILFILAFLIIFNGTI